MKICRRLNPTKLRFCVKGYIIHEIHRKRDISGARYIMGVNTMDFDFVQRDFSSMRYFIKEISLMQDMA
ncbi:hypothetical protein AXF42_Ash015402 [Apostasia shenzhenica]|uniref:Uncharacterized protein n=1 Tax=Apostasia shenzhenica TaxID=1088818 RepID=A0A2H9ZS41_9ASPA|nr:hypothetical protein AXF42_Ash015402 [Apostasia shenzhenica]